MNKISHIGILRISAALLTLALIAWGYFWMILAGALFFLFMYDAYYEIILWGVCFDALYGFSTGSAYAATVISIGLFFLGIFLRKRLSLYV